MRTTSLLVALCAAVVGCKSLPEQPPIQTQPLQFSSTEWRVTDQVVVITDASGTQYVNETFPEAKALTQSLVAAMPAANAPSASGGGYGAGLIGFGGAERVAAPVAPFDRGRLASTASQVELMGDLDGLGGTTPLHQVFGETERTLAGKPGRAAVVIFSDGMPDEPGFANVAAKQLIAARGGNVCFHTVQTGDDPEGTAFLQWIAQLTSCGSYRNGAQVSTSSDIQQLARAVFIGPAALPPVSAPSPCTGITRLHGVEFAFDKATLTGSDKVLLDAAVEQLRGCPNIAVKISGHTDAIGTAAYNEGLSQRRAESARGYMVQSGIASNRLSAQGFGESQPLATNDTDAGRALNRRVELSPSN